MSIQIIEENRNPTTAERMNQAFSNTANIAMKLGTAHQVNKLKEKEYEEENETAKRLGLDISGIRNPKTRENILSQGSKLAGNLEQQRKGYNIIKKAFGEKVADVWSVSEPGAQTAIINKAIDITGRDDMDVNEFFEYNSKQPDTNQQLSQVEPQKLPQMKNNKVPKDFKWPNYKKKPKGYTPKEFSDVRKTWRKENAPLFESNNTTLDSIRSDQLATKHLDNLNESRKLPEGVLERLILDPKTGEPYGIAQLANVVSPEVQDWVKTIARFQNRAKNAFGSRVTNFDLVQYMKQFPGLLNTYEGRKRIVKMMNINYALDSLYSSALQQIYQKYGLDGIPQEEADRLARGMIEDEKEKYETEYLGLDALNQKSKLSGKTVDVQGPDGQMYEVDQNEIDQLPEGYKVL